MRSPGPTLLLRQGHLEQMSNWVLCTSNGGDSKTSLGHLSPHLTTSTPLVKPLDTMGNSLTLLFLPSQWLLIHADKIPSCPRFSRLSSPSSQPLLTVKSLPQQVFIFLVLGSPELDVALQILKNSFPSFFIYLLPRLKLPGPAIGPVLRDIFLPCLWFLLIFLFCRPNPFWNLFWNGTAMAFFAFSVCMHIHT